MDSTELLFKSKEQDLAHRARVEQTAEVEWEKFTGTKAKGRYINNNCVEFDFGLWRIRRTFKRYPYNGYGWLFSRKCSVCGWWTVEESLTNFIDLANTYNSAACLNTRKCKRATWTKI